MMYPSSLYRFGVLCFVLYSCQEAFSVNFDYLGCFQDQEENRLLNGVKEISNELTPAICVDICSKRGFPFAGTQNSEECFCGSTRPPQIAKRSDAECSSPCKGTSTMKCGGTLKMSAYATDILGNGSIPSPFYLGCYKDYMKMKTENRLFPEVRQDSNHMTPRVCSELCFKKGYKLSGVQHGDECYCTNKRLSMTRKTDENECKIPCAGDATKKCGGTWRLGVYSTGLTDIPTKGRYLGCFRDAPGPDGGEIVRSLDDFKGRLKETNSPKICLNMCYQMGYRYAGVQYGFECFCGNKQPLQSIAKPDIDCDAACPGDDDEHCGGHWRLQAYRTPVKGPPPRNYADDPPALSSPSPPPPSPPPPPRPPSLPPLLRRMSAVSRPTSTTPSPKPETTAKPPEEDNDCPLSVTIVNAKRVCKNSVIFFDDFDQLDAKKWRHEVKIPLKPDYEFNLYTDEPESSFTKDGALYIQPILFNESFVETGEITFDQCTGDDFNGECSKNTEYSIMPPVQSARLTTKQGFNFKYGIVEVEAKLPIGDWITSEIALMPVDNVYGSYYESGKIRFAFQGNTDLKYPNSSKEVGYESVEGNVLLGYGHTVKEILLHFYEAQGWQDEFHNFTIIWSPDDIVFIVDGKKRQSVMQNSNGLRLSDMIGVSSSKINVWDSGTPLAPFDQPFYISLGAAVGGIRDFADGVVSHGYPKPWNNFDPKAMLTFWKSRQDWQNTWQPADTPLVIKSIKVKAL